MTKPCTTLACTGMMRLIDVEYREQGRLVEIIQWWICGKCGKAEKVA